MIEQNRMDDMTRFDYESLDVNTRSVAFHRAGHGEELVVLLHGWPQTARCWRNVIPSLSEQYTVVAPDLPGYGGSSPSLGGDKRSAAAILSEFVTELGFDSTFLVGHDRGARVAHRWAADSPQQIKRLAVLDVLPMLSMIERFDAGSVRRHWHWFFHLQEGLPERVIGGNVAAYLRAFLGDLVDRGVIEDAEFTHYAEVYSRPGRVEGFLADYRASFSADLRADEADRARSARLTMPVLVLWGAQGALAESGVLADWRTYADDVRGQALDCGHYLPDEQPDEVARELATFFDRR